MNPNKIHTTINFLQSRIDYVKEKSRESGITYKKLIKLCIDLFISQWDKRSFNESALKYQPDDDLWQKVHFAMTPGEYDVYFDVKKVSRCSFSLIVALAIDHCLESVLNGDQEFSYPTIAYSKICILHNNFPIYVLCWEKNEKMDEIEEILRE